MVFPGEGFLQRHVADDIVFVYIYTGRESYCYLKKYQVSYNRSTLYLEMLKAEYQDYCNDNMTENSVV